MTTDEMLREIEANRLWHAVIIDTMIRKMDELNTALEEELSDDNDEQLGDVFI